MFARFRFFLFSSIVSNPRRMSTLAQSMGEFKEEVFVCTRHMYRSQRRKGRGSWVGGSGVGVGGRGSGVGGREWPGVRAAPEKAEESGSRRSSSASGPSR